jgi:hypothetical protein
LGKHTAKNLKQRYGISVEQYKELLVQQDGKCAICKSPHSKVTGRNFHVDHCHTTGNIRGILCHHCNTALGAFNDDINMLTEALYYLISTKKQVD